jgi:hypothetical protein
VSAGARSRRVAVLGAGIMGSSVALELVRSGCHVVLVDAAAAPFSGASRWNEGKIHLGFLYAADPGLSTARSLLPGGLAFVEQVGELLGCDPAPAVSTQDDLYLVHRDSVVDAEAMSRRFEEIAALVRAHPGSHAYPGAAARARAAQLPAAELERLADTGKIRAGFRVPERSISTQWLADRYVEALHSTPHIELALSTRVHGVRSESPDGDRWQLNTDRPVEGSFDAVVNALWEGRLAIDASVGLQARSGWSHRYRVSLFVRTRQPVAANSIVVATGPFGDIKNYNDRDFYLSWYPAGLLAEGHAMHPPEVPLMDAAARVRIIDSVRCELGALVPSAHAILDDAESVQVQGGWVFAQGQGSLADPTASLHRRDRFGVRTRGSYLSVDTGKYSIAPWLARGIAGHVMDAT